ALTALLAALALTATTPAPAQAATPALQPGTGLHAAPSVRVRAPQRALHARGYHLGPAGIDGRFGPATAAAVRRLQAHHHLTTDAILGPRTRPALHRPHTPPPGPPPPPPPAPPRGHRRPQPHHQHANQCPARGRPDLAHHPP